MTPWLIGGYLVGLVSELVGIYFMANAHLDDVRRRDLPTLLASALVRGKEARGAALRDPTRPTEPTAVQESHLRSLQGLAFVAVGFIIQAVVTVISLLVV